MVLIIKRFIPFLCFLKIERLKANNGDFFCSKKSFYGINSIGCMLEIIAIT